MSGLFNIGRVARLQTPSWSYAVFLFVLICGAIHPALATDFTQCIAEIKSGEWGTVGLADDHGNPTSNISEANAITYELCIRACGSGPDAFQWSAFSQQFATWLLPNLALASQLPYGAKNRLGNLTSVVLALGSPMLAAYSLALTVLNGRWVTRRFQSIVYPNTGYAVRILNSLQQVSLRITSEDALLNSLVILHKNDEWWKELADALDYTQTWSMAAAASIAWVIIAYILSIIDAFNNFSGNSYPTVQSLRTVVNYFGKGVGFLWLWLLPVVVGWLQISPKCDWIRLTKALERTNPIAYVPTPNDVVRASTISEERAFMIDAHPDGLLCHRHGSIACDEELTAPIFNYTRLLGWVQAVEDVVAVFRVAAQKANHHIPVDPDVVWKGQGRQDIHRDNRTGTVDQVIAYCQAPTYFRRSRWGPGVYKRVIVASFFALSLQWGTTGAAILVPYLTPTVGLGCRSGAYLVYGTIATFIWAILLTSSVLSHYAHPRSHRSQRLLPSCRASSIAGLLSIILRRVGKVLATCNAIWLVVLCMFQFTSFFDSCYCASCVLGLRSRAFDIVQATAADLELMRSGWIAAVTLASGCALLFICFVNLFIDPTCH
ncbi:hypothetical protein JAAARDRAFT_166574 [Jaapia argillacea MUCL 33604]|uniref:Uncharacterized protein n=1 Tax=Jaapia argillacea MUCL 33604 TaxID=933084 RepID=A0A067QBF7_9AGAM|nr:hypothetical protein JAAARDRAFT_166574 [Jaapia argillacea MUCL 33604]